MDWLQGSCWYLRNPHFPNFWSSGVLVYFGWLDILTWCGLPRGLCNHIKWEKTDLFPKKQNNFGRILHLMCSYTLPVFIQPRFKKILTKLSITASGNEFKLFIAAMVRSFFLKLDIASLAELVWVSSKLLWFIISTKPIPAWGYSAWNLE